MDPVNALAKFEVRTSPVPEITAIAVLVGVVNPNLGKRSYTGSRMVPFERAMMTSYRPFIVTFPLS